MDEVQQWSKVPTEIMSYLTEVEQHFKSLEDAEEKQLLVANVLDELAGSELLVVTDPVGSRLLETLLKDIESEQLVRILRGLTSTENLYQASISGPGCHVLEKLLTRLLKCLLIPGQEHMEQLEEVLSKLVELITADLYDYIFDRNATYVARRVLCAVAGRDVLPVSKKGGERDAAGVRLLNTKGKRSGLAAKVQTATESERSEFALYPDLVTKFVEALQRSEFDTETLHGLAGSPFSGPFLQGLLAACKGDTTTLQSLVPRLLGANAESKDGEASTSALSSIDVATVHGMMQDTSSSHLVEAIFNSVPEDLQRELCRTCLSGHLSTLAFHPSANFVVQAALASTQHQKLVKDFFTELEPLLGSLLQSRRGGVVAALAACCKPVPKIRSQFCIALASAVSVLDDSCGVDKRSPQHLVAALLCLDAWVKLDGEHDPNPARLSTVGCAIMATVLQYPQDACKTFISSLLGLQPKQLKQIAFDRGGCRVLEALIEAEGPLPQKQRLMRSLRGGYGLLAVKPAGSFFVEKCYNWAEVDVKEDIVSELLSVETQLKGVAWGPGLVQLCGLEVYKSGRQQWWARANRSVKTMAQFSQLFGDTGGKGGRRHGNQGDDTSGKRKQASQAADTREGADEGKSKKRKKRKNMDDVDEDMQDGGKDEVFNAEPPADNVEPLTDHAEPSAECAEPLAKEQGDTGDTNKRKKERKRRVDDGSKDGDNRDAGRSEAGAGGIGLTDTKQSKKKRKKAKEGRDGSVVECETNVKEEEGPDGIAEVKGEGEQDVDVEVKGEKSVEKSRGEGDVAALEAGGKDGVETAGGKDGRKKKRSKVLGGGEEGEANGNVGDGAHEDCSGGKESNVREGNGDVSVVASGKTSKKKKRKAAVEVDGEAAGKELKVKELSASGGGMGDVKKGKVKKRGNV